MPQLLSGIRVIDLSMWWAGPFVTQLLGDMGAEIIKIESIQVPDGWRFTVPNAAHDKPWELSSYYNGVNRNKYGLTLNLQDPRGIELCKRLVGMGDVVVENYTPAGDDKLRARLCETARHKAGHHYAIPVGLWRHGAVGAITPLSPSRSRTCPASHS